MKAKIGTLNPNLVWLFALGTLLLAEAGGWATANLGNKVSSAVYFGSFAVGGFSALLLTRSKVGMGVLAFALASIAASIIYYFLVYHILGSATTEMASAMGGRVQDSQAAGLAMGGAVGLFAAGITLAVSLVAGIGGCIAGASQRKKFSAA